MGMRLLIAPREGTITGQKDIVVIDLPTPRCAGKIHLLFLFAFTFTSGITPAA